MIGELLQVQDFVPERAQILQDLRLAHAGQTVQNKRYEAVSILLEIGQYAPSPGFVAANEPKAVNADDAQEAGDRLAAQAATPAVNYQCLITPAQAQDLVDNRR